MRGEYTKRKLNKLLKKCREKCTVFCRKFKRFFVKRSVKNRDFTIISNNGWAGRVYSYLDMPYLSEKDKEDIIFGINNDVDYIAASFVRSANDVIELRKFLNYHGGHNIKIISKIENIDGIEAFDEILAETDGIMIARGDMGVEVEYERLPGLQKRFIRKCYGSGKIVITATQMLESMQFSYNPTRAEITDVANAGTVTSLTIRTSSLLALASL